LFDEKKIAEDTPDIHFVGAVFRGFSHMRAEIKCRRFAFMHANQMQFETF